MVTIKGGRALLIGEGTLASEWSQKEVVEMFWTILSVSNNKICLNIGEFK